MAIGDIIRRDGATAVKSRVALLLLALVMAIGFASLGRWQLRRAVEKEQRLSAVAQVLQRRSEIPLAQATASTAGTFAWSGGRGRFLTAPLLLLDNQRRGEAVGVLAFGVFQPDGGGRALLVDLGWLKVAGDRKLPDVALPPQSMRLSGLLTPPPSAGIVLGPSYTIVDAHRWLLVRVDLAVLSAALRRPLAPRIMRLDPALPLGYTRDLDVLPNTLPPERHRAYAVQWFAMAAVILFLALFLGLRRRPA